MVQRLSNAKIVSDPLWGLIDISEYLPMIDVPAFQALGFKYQLGVNSLLFPAATHTRKQHSLGALRRTQDLADRWLHRGFISKEEARLIIAYALWHDIGHGPFSHVIEAVTKNLWGRDHDQNGALIIHNLKDAVASTGIDFSEFEKMFTHENPLYRAVHDKNLGTEKLDYLSRDAYYTLGERPGVEYLAHHTYFINGELVIDEKAIDSAKALQEFYIKMYKAVYLRKNSAIAQRVTQQMVWEFLQHEPMDENTFWSLTDFGLLGRLEASHEPEIQRYYQRFMRRELPRTALVFRPERFAEMENSPEKAQTVLGLSEEHMNALIASPALNNAMSLQKIEAEIERIAGLPERSVCVVPPISVERFVPQDIAIYAPGGKTKYLGEYFAGHFESLAEEGSSYTVLRVCTYAEHREALSGSQTAGRVQSYILSLAAESATAAKIPH